MYVAQVIVWGIESVAAGYTPEQCRIDFPVIDGRCVMSLVWSVEKMEVE